MHYSHHRRNRKYIYVIAIVIFVVILGGMVGYKEYESYNTVTYDLSKALSYANRFYSKGEIDKAINQLKYYCNSNVATLDDNLLLAKWYEENGQVDKRDSLYYSLMSDYNIEANQLSVKKTSYSFTTTAEPIIKIEPLLGYTQDVRLFFSGETISPSDFVDGGVSRTALELSKKERMRTTAWMSIDSERDSLILCGDFNCSIWQFMDCNENITYVRDDALFNDNTSVSLERQSFSRIDIPEGAVKCRVTFYDKSISEFSQQDNIGIYYGSIPQGFSGGESIEWELPDLNDGEYLVYSSGVLRQYKDNEEVQSLEVEAPLLYNGSVLTMEGKVCGLITVSYSDNESGDNHRPSDLTAQYGIKRQMNSSIPICERIGDSVGMHFDYVIGGDWVNPIGKNDFDSAYPWSNMRLCNVNAGEIVYEGEEKYSNNGSNGNVMVEIPKFYVKRVRYDEFEEIWISGTKHDGYVLDPVFLDNGMEKDFVYIGAYLGSEDQNKILSVSNSYPTVRIKYSEALEEALNNGEGFSEINYFMYSAIQKLFMVETGTLDSTALFSGETDAYFYSTSSDISRTGIAVESGTKTNTITVNDVGPTRKMEIGTSVIIMNINEEWNAYNRFSTNNLREVVGQTIGEGHISIEVSGDPIDVVQNETLIASFPSLTGKTDGIGYCTGVYRNNSGKFGFKYRFIENLYGSALVMLDSDAFLQDGYFFFENQNGEITRLSLPMPIQNTTLNVAESGYNSGNVNCIKQMSFEEEYPTIMIPVEIGASSYTYYCDYYYYSDNGEGEKVYLCMGSADDNRRIGGMFQFRGVVTSMNYSGKFIGTRIMYR